MLKRSIMNSLEFLGLSQAFNQLKHLKRLDDALVEKYNFVDALGIAFHQGLHTDVELVPNEGPSIHAHRIVMATKSPVFRNMFEADECKGPHTGSVSFSDMGHDQLKSLVEFLYSGSLSEDKIEQHGHALFIAADKYDIPFLRKTCETHISNTINPLNALDVLELATMCSATALKETAINAILRHQDEIIFSEKYESFALKNALLSVEVTKALLKDMKGKIAIQTKSTLKI
ncbi:BTB/POZ domain-containing protein At1g01640 isoform X2 [Cryptomeria japonica]|uniref:BTB/POZ domain-containing protein At1g01640 isoform X2 n=1 Tax=Cryptomeria japonica TaxID=3369 RepID=UPI0027D9FE0B|nr:BTB/POZ domain-containing protein At1g01640 isoform X2 [Cryptomeria japonica]